MNDAQKKELANKFFDELVTELNKRWKGLSERFEWVVVESCNKDFSRYLVLTVHGKPYTGDITYHSKPWHSFRISDHWNWFANIKKCEDPFYVQCNSLDMPYP